MAARQKREIQWAISIFLMMLYFSGLQAQAQYGGGTGEPNDPYQIATAEDLMLLGESPEDYDKNFILTADIDLDPNLPGRKVFDRAVIAPDTNDVEIGFQGTYFTGVFDGNDHTISHLTITGGSDLGLFGELGDSIVSSVTLEAVDVSGTGSCIGGLAGCNIAGKINASYSTGTTNGQYGVGGLVGWNSGSIVMSHSTVIVSGNNAAVGGLVGSNSGTITNSCANGSVSGNWDIGGLVGENGGCCPPMPGTISNCYSTGSVSGDERVGGLLGSHKYTIITNCYSTSSVSGTKYVGGLVGYVSGVWDLRGGMSYSYSTGTVRGDDYVGGLVGFVDRTRTTNEPSNGDVYRSFWDVQTSGQTTHEEGIGLTTAEMQTAITFLEAGWDFIGETENGIEDIWSICEGTNYPRLAWQIPAGDFVCPDGIAIEDFVFFIEHWRQETCDLSNDYCQGTDLDFSGTVDEADLEILIENWLESSELEN